jgi:hypothetical protein
MFIVLAVAVVLQWSYTEEQIAAANVTHFQVQIDGAWMTVGDQTTREAPLPDLSDGAVVAVRACNSQICGESEVAVYSVPPPPPPPADTTAPVVTLVSTTRSGGSHNYNVSVTATDNAAVTRVEYWLNGVQQTALTAPTSGTLYTGKVSIRSPGTHQIDVYGYDAAGNVGRATAVITR